LPRPRARYPAPVRQRSHRRVLAAIGTLSIAFACGSGEPSSSVTTQASEPRASVEAEKTASAPGKSEHDHAAHRKEKPLPAFGGWTLTGEKLEVGSLLGKRLVLFFFNPEVAGSKVVAEAVRTIAKRRGEHNFEVLGIATGSGPEESRSFVAAHGIDYPVLDDSSASIARRMGLRFPIAMLGVDAEGYVTFGIAQFMTDGPKAQKVIESQLRTALRLPTDEAPLGVSQRPMAPLFEASVLDGDAPFKLADTRGKPVVLVFFLHTCPHCHEFLKYMKPQLQAMPEGQRPVFVGVEITGKTYAVREELKKEGIDYFPVLFDEDSSIRDEYGVFAGVPDTVLIDKQGRIAARIQGWRTEVDGPLIRMRMAKLADAPVPMLLKPSGYSGSDACGVCHEPEHRTWQITQHASAYDTLVKHGADTDPECVSCHVVGLGKPGGFDLENKPKELEDVGCESCHGRGGPHLSPTFVTAGNYENACAQCHDKKHSLGFEYASFVPQISHTANAAILALPDAEREKILAERGGVRKNLLPSTAAYVGSDACTSCHSAEHTTWAANSHAKSVATLSAKGEASNPECLACHTTAFGKNGGFPADGAVGDHPDLAKVGCESCHGPGGDHVPESAVKLGTIVSLGDKCDSCVILQICGSCHDDANDPGFNFEVQDKIDRIRHGTIEAGTGKPLEGKSARRAPAAPLHEDLARAFAHADATASPIP
jgi:peroxiredoxin